MSIKYIVKTFAIGASLFIILNSALLIVELLWIYEFNLALLGYVISIIGACILSLAFTYLAYNML